MHAGSGLGCTIGSASASFIHGLSALWFVPSNKSTCGLLKHMYMLYNYDYFICIKHVDRISCLTDVPPNLGLRSLLVCSPVL